MIERDHHPYPDELPAELAEALRDGDYACLTAGTERGTILVVKAPAREIAAVNGAFPVEPQRQLYQHPAAPVIRLLLRLYDDPSAPLTLETFINVADPFQRADYSRLAAQDAIELRFSDEILLLRLTKRISHSAGPLVPVILAAADTWRRHIPNDLYNNGTPPATTAAISARGEE